jgi:hypothetical protein
VPAFTESQKYRVWYLGRRKPMDSAGSGSTSQAPEIQEASESGEISVITGRSKKNKEIAEIQFDTDISLRLNESKEVGKRPTEFLLGKECTQVPLTTPCRGQWC